MPFAGYVTLLRITPSFGQISSPVPRPPISEFLEQGKYLASGGEHVFVAPRPGVLRIIPQYIAKAFNDVPDTAYLKVTFAGNVNSTTLPPYFACTHNVVLEIPDNCTGGTFILPYYSRQHSNFTGCLSAPLDTFYTGNVQTGDTVRFTYHAELVNPTFQEITMGTSDSSGTVFMGTLLTNAQCFSDPWFREEASVVFTFADTVVKIRRPHSVNVYPTYPNKNDSLAKKNYMDLELSVEFANSAIPNYWVRLDTAALADSGGHSHGGARPKGKYIVPKLTGTGVDTMISGTRKTDSTGVLRFKFLASQFGGSERIKAKLVSDTTKTDTLSLITRVPGLQLLPEGTNYVKVGGTCRHHGPEGPAGCSTPDNDHWGKLAMIQGISSIADSFAQYYPGYRIRINDISLPYGGGFDLGGNWEDDIIDKFASRDTCNLVGHCTHREGNIADISYFVRPPSGPDSLFTEPQKRRVRRILDNAASSVLQHGHYHFRIR